jgi:hypothetical protein
MSARRFETREKAAIEIYGKSGVIYADLKNLSKTGACIECRIEGLPLIKGDLIRMTVTLEQLRKSYLINAEVIWANGPISGLTFLQPKKLVEKLVEKGSR